MTPALLVVCGLLAASPVTGPTPGDLEAYQAARAGVGRDPVAQVRLALWCEAHGLRAERTKHLALAVLLAPENATARGLMGLVAYRGQWKRPEDVAAQVRADAELTARLAEYEGKRARAGETADAQWKLAVWCEQAGLTGEAKAHFAAVTRLDPGREAAWKRLGCKKVGARWVTDAEIAAERAEADAQKKADRHWRPLLAKWHAGLNDRARDRQEAAEKALGELTDPRAVPAVWESFVTRAKRGESHAKAVQLLGQIDAPASSQALASLAAFDDNAEVRRAAVETLKRRDPRDFAGLLVALVRDPIKYEVRPVGGPGEPGAIFVQGKKFNVRRVYSPPAANIPYLPDATLSYDANGLAVLTTRVGTSRSLVPFLPTASPPTPAAQGIALALSSGSPGAVAKGVAQANAGAPQQTPTEGPGLTPGGYFVERAENLQIPVGQMLLEAQQGAAVAARQLEDDVSALEDNNDEVRRANSRVLMALSETTGQSLGEDREAWSRWWADVRGYAAAQASKASTPTLEESVAIAYTGQARPQLATGDVVGIDMLQHSCFGAGTPVRTQTGLRPIEQVRVGDLVLTQDTTTGGLNFEPVVAVYKNPPNPTLRVALGEGEPVVATGIHRFWKAGQGWVMARDLKPGDPLRAANGPVTVASVGTAGTQPVFNLEVAGGHSFFVGSGGLLVHDNSLVKPVDAPFDAATALAAAPVTP